MKPLFLIGYMGCGKSTLGRKLARRLGIGFVDTDTLVEEQAGASVADVFRYEGEARFREAEREALERAIAAGGEAVVSTGGGLPTWGDNMQRMNGVGHTVFLRRSAAQIASRLSPYGRRKRPRLRGWTMPGWWRSWRGTWPCANPSMRRRSWSSTAMRCPTIRSWSISCGSSA